MIRGKLWVLATLGLAFAGVAEAQTGRHDPFRGEPARLIRPAEFGTVREVLGAARYLAQPKADCPAQARPIEGGPCFDKVWARLKATGETRARVLGLQRAALSGEIIRGQYGVDFSLYDLFITDGKVSVEALDLPTSAVTVPRNCFALRGEGVTYAYEMRGDQDVAQERQVVACDGGPRQPDGPYAPRGATIPPEPPMVGAMPYVGGETWAATETLVAEGRWRYLAYPDPACAPEAVMRKVYCAQSGINFLKANAGEKELDLIAAKWPVSDGQVLIDKDIEQLVLKRTSKGFKADKRWFAKSLLTLPADCSGNEPVFFRVRQQNEERFVVEEQLARCGAPPPPVPFEVYEAYGEARPVAQARRDCPAGMQLLPETCFDEVVAFMKAFGHNALDVLVIGRSVRDGEYVYKNFDMAKVRRGENGQYQAERRSGQTTGNVELYGCNDHTQSPESRGYLIQWRGRSLMAIEYEWKSCPVY